MTMRVEVPTHAVLLALSDEYEMSAGDIVSRIVNEWSLEREPEIAAKAGVKPRKRSPFSDWPAENPVAKQPWPLAKPEPIPVPSVFGQLTPALQAQQGARGIDEHFDRVRAEADAIKESEIEKPSAMTKL